MTQAHDGLDSLPLSPPMNARGRGGFPVSADELARQHRLTRAEALVVRELCRGLAPEAIATARNVSITTVRTQLRRAMDKVDARSQAALVAIVLRAFL